MSPASVLLVDDQPANLFSLETILRPLGHRLVTADSCDGALKQLLLHDFAAILLDVRMPGLDGYETASLIRERERSMRTPIIFLTAETGDRDDTLRAYDHGAVDFLGKPFEPRILRAKVAIFISLFVQAENLKRQTETLRAQERAAIRFEAASQTAGWLRELNKVYEGLEAQLNEASSPKAREHLEQLRSHLTRMRAVVDESLGPRS